MKKLMIAAAFAAATLCSNAAAINWTLTSEDAPVYAGYKASSVGGTYTAGFANPGAMVYAVYYDSMDQDALLAALRSGKSMSDLSANLVSATGIEVGADGTYKGTITGDDSYLDGDSSIDAYVAIIDGNNVFLTSDDYFVYSETFADQRSINPSVGGSKYLRDLDMTKNFSSDGWYTTSTVPEPTSGLLLLLGVAGLALKRKRA